MAFAGPDPGLALESRLPEEAPEDGEPERRVLLGPPRAPERPGRRRALAAAAFALAGVALLATLGSGGRRSGRARRPLATIGASELRQLQPDATSQQAVGTMRRDWNKVAADAAHQWASTLEGDFNKVAENTTDEWAHRMDKKMSLAGNNASRASRSWADTFRGDWLKVVRNATNWAHTAQAGWDQRLNDSSGWTRTMDSWWQNLERSEEFRETLEREKRWQARLKKGLEHRLGDVANATDQIDREMLNKQMRHALKGGLGTVGNLTAKATEWRGDINELLHPGQNSNGSAAQRCADLDGLYIEKVLHSNLGGKGPQGGAQSLVFVSNHTEGGVMVKHLAFRITALSPYFPGWAQMNGLSHGLVGKYGQVTIKPGTNVTLRIQTYDLESRKLIHMPNYAFTFFDLDEDGGHEASEYVSASNFTSFEISEESEVRVTSNPDGSSRFQASTPGTYDDNPVDPLLLTEQQKNRAVTLRFGAVDEIEVVIGATPSPSDPGTWRCFTFVAHPVLKCAKIIGEKPPSGPSDMVLVGAVAVCMLLAVCIGCFCCCL